MSKPLLVLGAGGHAAVLVDILKQLNCEILGIVSLELPGSDSIFSGLPWYSSDDDVLLFNKEDVLLVNALGSLPGNSIRCELHKKFKVLGYQFKTIVAPSARVSQYAVIDEGSQILPGSIVNINASIGEGSIINTGAIIEHDCVIGRHNHIAPGAVLSGAVVTDDNVHIATGANVIQNIHIGENTVVGAGATVTRDLGNNKVLYGAKPFLNEIMVVSDE